jgi:hypothetical protein
VLAISNSDDLALSVPTTSATTMHARMTRDTSATHLLTVEPEVKPLMNAILPCGHALCEACEKRWVRKRLVCPFCRHRYSSAKQVASGGYHVAEWSESDLDSDIAALDEQVREFWKTVQCNQPTSTSKEALLATYLPAKRTSGSYQSKMVS